MVRLAAFAAGIKRKRSRGMIEVRQQREED
jgi:hypothetical protein